VGKYKGDALANINLDVIKNNIYLLLIVTMEYLAQNIKHLRQQRELTQEQLAGELIITRVSLASYEGGRNEPPIQILQRIARYFHLTMDVLVSVDLTAISVKQLMKMGDNRVLLPITVDGEGNDLIEVIPQKASAGYLNGYGDPEYIQELQRFSLPFMPVGKHRAFPIKGDSMPPLGDGSYVVGKYIEHASEVTDGNTYVLITLNDGIVYKRVYNQLEEKAALLLVSDNKIYDPYLVPAEEIVEIWEYTCSINTRQIITKEVSLNNVHDMLSKMQVELADIRANKVGQV
jgi:transcriptional regulator with XRE-family HTH domain